MTLKDQWKKIKDNWLLIAAVLVLIAIFGNLGGSSNYASSAVRESFQAMGGSSAKMASANYATDSMYYPTPASDFAPEVKDRIITKTTSITEEIKRGEFLTAESKLKAIITSSDSFLLNENANIYGEGWDRYYSGSYQIKIESSKYSSVITQLKELGKVTSFNENADDITGQYTDTNVELEAEKERMTRYRQMYSEAITIEDKINLNDRIFNQERTIKYLEDSIKNMDNRVSYSTIYLTMNEKQSTYSNIALVKLGELVRNLVNSFNSLLSLLFTLLPWAVAAGLVWGIVRFFKKRA